MQFNTLFFLLSLCCLCLALAQVSYDDCCLRYVKKNHFHQKYAVKYRRQQTDGGCNIPAIIFTMRKGRLFCTNPNEEWVVELMNKIDKKGTRNQKQKQQAKRG